ncbi:MAG TPA: hypothetical protein VJJ52_02220 [Candidatus Nanoarchaeia archaeon]|nr:hypothetical protein [Candidatus Nanoarchaeia archaeon]
MISATLVEKVKADFSKIKIGKSRIKVPKLKINAKKQKISAKKFSSQIPISTLINILIRNSIETARREAKEKIKTEADRSYRLIKNDNELIFGGYGTSSKNYGSLIHTPYVDYGKLFGYLGIFKASSVYESSNANDAPKAGNRDAGFGLIDSSTIEKGARFVRYMKHPTIDLNTSSLVPSMGMDSQEWENFKLWKQLDPVMYLLKTSTS